MGYPMTYSRVIRRNALDSTYRSTDDPVERVRALIAGDLRRLELDARDPYHLRQVAELAGITAAQAKIVLDVLFEGAPNHGPWGHSVEEYYAETAKLTHLPDPEGG